MRRKKLGNKEQVKGYVDRFEDSVIHCGLAKDHEETAEVFLWSAYRCLEAMLRALLVPYPPRKFEEMTVKELLDDASYRTIIPNELTPIFETVWRLSRPAIRVRDHHAPNYVRSVPQCAQALAETIEWFYKTSPAKREVSKPVEDALEVLRSSEVVQSRDQLNRENQRALFSEIESNIEDRKKHIDVLKSAASTLSAMVDSEQKALDNAQGRLRNIQKEVDKSGGFPLFSPPSKKIDEGQSLGQKYLWVLTLVGGVILGMAASLIAMDWENYGSSETSELEQGNMAQSDEPAHDETSPSDGGPESQQGENPVSTESEGSGTEKVGEIPCPEGMVAFESAVVRLIQPFPRRSWPAGPKSLPPVKVRPFCIDRDPVLVSDYELCAAKGVCRPRIRCLDHPRNYPVNCVTWVDAQTYCRWKDATLPTVVQWERTLLFGAKVRAEPTRGTWEWTSDPFPAKVFRRGKTKRNEDGTMWGFMALQKQFVPNPKKGGRRICSWHKVPATASRGNLSFRCAKSL